MHKVVTLVNMSTCKLNIDLVFFYYLFQKREAEFNEYMQDKIAGSKADFRQLLKETHFITHK